MDQRTRGLGGPSGRVILLRDGTELLTDSEDQEMFDHEVHDVSEDDRITDSSQLEKQRGESSSEEGKAAAARSQREGTPGPEATITQEPQKQESEAASSTAGIPPSAAASMPDSLKQAAGTSPRIKAMVDTAIPSKLQNPTSSKDA